jgi:hypothetical protein
MAGVVADARPLDLYDLRAEIGEQLPRPRPGKDAGELEDFEAFERLVH